MIIGKFQLDAVARRYNESRQLRERNKALSDGGQAIRADDPTRLARFLARHGSQGKQVASIMGDRADDDEKFALERVLGQNDLMGVAFLEGGLHAGRSVGRISLVDGGRVIDYGTGFLVARTRPHGR